MADNQGENLQTRFRLIRKMLHMNQQELADRIGVKQSHVSAIEKGKRNITGDIKLALEDRLRINRDWLDTGLGDMIKDKKSAERQYQESEADGIAHFGENTFVYEAKTNASVVKVPMYKQLPADKSNLSGYLLLPGVKEGSVALRVRDESDSETEMGTWVIIRLAESL